MKQLNKRFCSKKITGFSLLEVVVALLITVMSISLLTESLSLVKKNNSSKVYGNEVAFCYVQLTKFLENNGGFRIVESHSDHTQLTIEKKKTDKNDLEYKTYVIEQKGNVLRVRGARQGHMPLLVKIKKASFKFDKKKFLLSITQGDGRRSELVFKAKEFAKGKESIR